MQNIIQLIKNMFALYHLLQYLLKYNFYWILGNVEY